MAPINWFPGHMSKTLKQMQADSKVCDCFVYVVDARCPTSCINPEFVKVCNNKPIIFVLNKVRIIVHSLISRLYALYLFYMRFHTFPLKY